MNRTIKAEELYTVNEKTGERLKFYGGTAGCGTMEGLMSKMVGFIRFPFGTEMEKEIDNARYVGFRLHRRDSVHGKSTPVNGVLRGEWSEWVEVKKGDFKGTIRAEMENEYAIYDDAELLIITGEDVELGSSIDWTANVDINTNMGVEKPFDIYQARLDIAERFHKKIMSGKYDYDELRLFIDLTEGM